jgi:hypothetical protein
MELLNIISCVAERTSGEWTIKVKSIVEFKMASGIIMQEHANPLV